MTDGDAYRPNMHQYTVKPYLLDLAFLLRAGVLLELEEPLELELEDLLEELDPELLLLLLDERDRLLDELLPLPLKYMMII